MPELPEVETARKFVHQLCAGAKIVRIETREQGQGPRDGLFDEIVFEEAIDSAVQQALDRLLATENIKKAPGRKVTKYRIDTASVPVDSREGVYHQAMLQRTLAAVRRKGKQLWFEFEDNSDTNGPTTYSQAISDLSVLFHFGMTGSFVIRDHAIPTYKSFQIVTREEWPPKFTKLELEFSNGIHIAFCDPRRLGRIKLRVQPTQCPPLSNLALDPSIDILPSAASLRDTLQAFSTSIKALILDQEKVFCGIGNYLADEVLYQAGIHPETRACDINEAGCQTLLERLQHIINTAVQADAKYEDFPREWLFHYRWDKAKANSGEKLRMPDGSAIVFETCGGRTSAVVPTAQPKNGYYFTKATTAVKSNSATKTSRKSKTQDVKVEVLKSTSEVQIVEKTPRKRKLKEEAPDKPQTKKHFIVLSSTEATTIVRRNTRSSGK